MEANIDNITQFIVDYYINSNDFNGISLADVLMKFENNGDVINILENLIIDDIVECAFYKHSINVHIRRLKCLPIKDQVKLIHEEPHNEIGCYPTKKLISSCADVGKYFDKPFTKELFLGAAQLDYICFDLSVLERYLNDPRYLFYFDDFDGRIVVSNDAYEDMNFSERDKILIESFSIGYDDKNEKFALVFYRYLTRLTAEHQQYWNSFRSYDKIRILSEYYNSAILGEWKKGRSYFTAILKEIAMINGLTNGIYSVSLFKEDYSGNKPKGLSFFLRTTLENYNIFIHDLDKILSENINRDFFKANMMSLEAETIRKDGKVIVTQKGSVKLLEEWLRTSIRWKDEDDAIKTIIGPIKDVRVKRQKPAHIVERNKYAREYELKQRKILSDIYLSLSNIRHVLCCHPRAPKITIPNYIINGTIAHY